MTDIDIEKLFEDDTPKPNVQNAPLMPQHPFRMLVNGGSGCGKTTIVFKALLNGDLKFDKLYIYARDIYEHKYSVLIKHYCNVAGALGIDPGELIMVGNSPQDIVSVDSLDPTKVHLLLFDDWIADKKTMDTIISEHWIRGRKKNASYVFMSQSYVDVPKKIRLNCDYFALFKVPTATAMRHLTSELKGDLEYDEFKRIFHEATKKKHDWILVDKKTEVDELKFRIGFDRPLKKRLEFESDDE